MAGEHTMLAIADQLIERRREEYERRTLVDRLRREIYGQHADPASVPELLEELAMAEAELEQAEGRRREIQGKDPKSGLILTTARDAPTHRGAETTGLEVQVHLNMAHVPTSFYHLLSAEHTPLLTCTVEATRRLDDGPNKRRVRVSSRVEGYSAMATNSFEIGIGKDKTHTFKQLPTFFPQRVREVTELTRATLSVEVEDLDGKMELHQTEAVWLLARTSAPLAVMDPQTGKWRDLTPYLGAFVTPNSVALMTFLREAADVHPEGRLVGYQGSRDNVTPQVKALFDALKVKAEITYVNSVVDFNPQQGLNTQRVRLPRESLADREANCIDGTVLFASLLEGISMSPAIVLVPGHAFLAWETWRDGDGGSNQWRYLETTMIGSSTFEQACASAEHTAGVYESRGQLRMWPLTKLRVELGITPME
jgi:hypothetical protein